MAQFVYRERSQAAIHNRATKQGGDFQGYVRDEFRVYKVRPGENCIRILPPTWESEHYGMDIYSHWNIGPDKATILCLRRMANQPCPVCEEVNRLDKSGDPEAAKELSPRLGILTWIVDRKAEAAGEEALMLYNIPPSLDRDIQKHSQDRQTGSYFVIDNPYDGFDIYFDKTGDRLQTRYTGVERANQPTSVDQSYLDAIAETPVPDTLNWRDYDEIAMMFSGGVEVPSRAAAGAGRPTPRGNGTAQPSQRPGASATPSRGAAPSPAPGRREMPAPQPQPGARLAGRPPVRSAPPPQEEEYDPDPRYGTEPPFDNGEYYEEPEVVQPPVRRQAAPPPRGAAPPMNRPAPRGAPPAAPQRRQIAEPAPSARDRAAELGSRFAGRNG